MLFKNCKCGQLLSCELRPRDQHDNTLGRTRTAFNPMGHKRLIILAPQVLGRTCRQMGPKTFFLSKFAQIMLTAPFSHDLVLIRSLGFLQYIQADSYSVPVNMELPYV
jgi:hypothetical protein